MLRAFSQNAWSGSSSSVSPDLEKSTLMVLPNSLTQSRSRAHAYMADSMHEYWQKAYFPAPPALMLMRATSPA
jgi:hypothetical protein